MKRKYLLVLLLIVFLCGCNSKKTDDQHIKTTVGENRSSGSDVGRMEIVSEYHSENSHLIATGEEIDPEEYLQIFQYARKTEKGVEMVYLDSTFLSGRLLYEVSNARIVYSLKEMTVPENGFSPDICGVDENGMRTQPNWIKEDGSFEGHSVILFDVNVTNDNVEQRTEKDKFGNETDPYTFSATQFLFLIDQSIKPGGPYSNYNTIRYFSAMQDNADYAYSFRLMPGESAMFTIGFVLGKPESRFNSSDNLLLSNVSGNSDGVLIDPDLEG